MEMTKLPFFMDYGCYILLQFDTKSRTFCRNYNFELLMQKHDQAYLACKFRRKYVCDNDMQYSIAREGILIY